MEPSEPTVTWWLKNITRTNFQDIFLEFSLLWCVPFPFTFLISSYMEVLGVLWTCRAYSCLRAFAHNVSTVSEAFLPGVHVAHSLTSFRYFLKGYFVSKDFSDPHRWKSSSYRAPTSALSLPCFVLFFLHCLFLFQLLISIHLFYFLFYLLFSPSILFVFLL